MNISGPKNKLSSTKIINSEDIYLNNEKFRGTPTIVDVKLFTDDAIDKSTSRNKNELNQRTSTAFI